jgi:hypothetical protein
MYLISWVEGWYWGQKTSTLSRFGLAKVAVLMKKRIGRPEKGILN